jgi:hypothetical protein
VKEVDQRLPEVKNQIFQFISVVFVMVETKHSERDGNEGRRIALKRAEVEAANMAWINAGANGSLNIQYNGFDFWPKMMKDGTAEFYAMGYLDGVRLTRTRVVCNVVGAGILSTYTSTIGGLKTEMERQMATAPADATILRLCLSAVRVLYAAAQPGKLPAPH